jgi:hypothetical protein
MEVLRNIWWRLQIFVLTKEIFKNTKKNIPSEDICSNFSPDMRYYADAADAVCVKNIWLCVKFKLEFTHLTQNVTI